MEFVQEENNMVDIERAHKHMQESIKQMKLNEDELPSGRFNGQNSLYELAQRIGHQPLSSSNVDSRHLGSNYNDNEF